MAMRSDAQLKQLLDELYHRYSRPVYLSTSALRIPHNYAGPEDREVTAFITACLAYGNVTQIHRSAEAALEAMGDSPARFIRRFDPVRDSARLQHVVHRFNSGVELAVLCH